MMGPKVGSKDLVSLLCLYEDWVPGLGPKVRYQGGLDTKVGCQVGVPK